MKRRGARAPTPLHYAAVVVAAAALTGAVGHLVTPPLLSRSPITALSLAAHAAADNGSETVVDVGSGSTPEPALDDGRSLLDPLAATITTVNRAAEQTLLTNTTAGSPVASSSDSNGSTSSTLVVDLLSTVATGMVGTIDPADPTTRQLGTPRAMDDHFLIANWQDCVVVILFCLLIVVTVIGNTLVILSVITTRRLRTVTNCFVMSLAVADWLVGIFVMPPAVAVHLMGSWQLGWILCDIWISLDVLLCTASILSLCAISIDRYLAVTQPLNYSRRRRSKRLALLMILVVWVLALAITCPPILGWYEPGRRELNQCRYNQNEGYVVFSAMGSFFIPMTVMLYVYIRISCVVASRHDKMTEIEVHKKSHRIREPEEDGYQSELDPIPLSPKRKRSSSQLSTATTTYVAQLGPMLDDGGPPPVKPAAKRNHHKNGHYELMDLNTSGGVAAQGKTTILSAAGNGPAAGPGDAQDELHHEQPSLDAIVDDSAIDLGADSNTSAGVLSPTATTAATANYNKLSSTAGLWSSGNNVFNQQSHKPQSHSLASSPPLTQQQQQQHFHHHHHHHHDGRPTAALAAARGLRRNNTVNTSITTSTCSTVQLVGGQRGTGCNNIRVHQKSLSSRISSMKRENKTNRTLSFVVGGFIACWLPFFIHYIITPFLPKDWTVPKLGEFFTWLGWINSAINPFIYAFYSVDFRAAFWRLTLRRFFRNSEKAPFANIHQLSMRAR